MTTIFDQKNQNVKNQTNVAGNLDVSGNYIAGDFFAAAQSTTDVLKELEKLKGMVTEAAKETQLDEDTAKDVESNLKKAIDKAKQPQPDKNRIVAYLNSAKSLVESITAAGGLVTAFTKAVEAVRKLF